MTVLDAYAVIAYLRGETCADEVSDLLRGPAVLTSVNAAEVRDQMVRVFGADADGMEADLALLCHAGLTVQAVTQELGMQAGRIRARRYHRERAAVSLADCVAAAAALALGSPLATSDPALADVLRSEGGNVHPLPDSKGRRPSPAPAGHVTGTLLDFMLPATELTGADDDSTRPRPPGWTLRHDNGPFRDEIFISRADAQPTGERRTVTHDIPDLSAGTVTTSTIIRMAIADSIGEPPAELADDN